MKLKAAVITVSDKASRGEREDRGGPALVEYLKQKDCDVIYQTIVPDEVNEIKNAILEASESGADLILTTGGTGFSKRDVTPEATLEIAEKVVPGVSEYIRIKSSEITKNAILSRGACVIFRDSVVLNLPGSPKGAVESLEFVFEALAHGIEVLKGEVGEHA